MAVEIFSKLCIKCRYYEEGVINKLATCEILQCLSLVAGYFETCISAAKVAILVMQNGCLKVMGIQRFTNALPSSNDTWLYTADLMTLP